MAGNGEETSRQDALFDAERTAGQVMPVTVTAIEFNSWADFARMSPRTLARVGLAPAAESLPGTLDETGSEDGPSNATHSPRPYSPPRPEQGPTQDSQTQVVVPTATLDPDCADTQTFEDTPPPADASQPMDTQSGDGKERPSTQEAPSQPPALKRARRFHHAPPASEPPGLSGERGRETQDESAESQSPATMPFLEYPTVAGRLDPQQVRTLLYAAVQHGDGFSILSVRDKLVLELGPTDLKPNVYRVEVAIDALTVELTHPNRR